MTGSTNPFLDPARVRGDLYADGGRLVSRSSALKRAKIAGRDVPEVIIELARDHLTSESAPKGAAPGHVLDVGCGRGSSSLALSAAFPSARITLADLSKDLLSAARGRLLAADLPAATVQADFHRLPVPDGCFDLIVAAFCLYHSTAPGTVVAEFARCLRGPGSGPQAVIVVTKSEDSYHELDNLVASAGLDEHATSRASLYETAHSTNVADIVESALRVQQVVHEKHAFRFEDLAHLAQYVATVPKYQLPAHLQGREDRIADALHRRLPNQPVTTTSTVTYVVATGPSRGDSDTRTSEEAR